MILGLYLVIEALALLFFLIGFFRRVVLSWGISLVLFGAQVLSSYVIQNYVYYVTSNGTVVSTVFTNSYPVMAYVNMIFFAVSLIYLIADSIGNKKVGNELL